jgi:hypothetical protein
MKSYLHVYGALATRLISGACILSLKADEFDKKTIITISQPVAVQEKALPAGRYVLRLQDSASTRNVVYVFNGKETELITTVLAIHAYRLQSTHKSHFSFYDSPAGQPAALHTWFYPGDNSGFEFLRPQHKAAAEPGAAGH